MSSFVIGKKEFYKAFGVIVGARESNRNWFLYDFQLKRDMTNSDYWNKFEKIHDAMVKVVCDRYGDDPKRYEDNTRYADECMKARHEWFYGDNVKRTQIAVEIDWFFRSVEYQIDDDDKAMEEARTFFNGIMMNLYRQIVIPAVKPDSWGKLTLEWDFPDVERMDA